jgi:hypothetical protein
MTAAALGLLFVGAFLLVIAAALDPLPGQPGGPKLDRREDDNGPRDR